MHKPFLIDKETITYNDLISLVNGESIKINLSEFQSLIVSKIKNLLDGGILNYSELVETLKSKNKNIILETSGTTGSPKIITHTFESITKNIKISENRFNDIWAFTYNPDKMAGYQVLLQALLNGNTLVNLFKCDFKEASDRIIKYEVTHISATPTFYKLLTSEGIDYLNVKQISFGGEGSTLELQSEIKKRFPNARVKNIYASTEVSSLFATDGDTFIIPEKYKSLINLSDGKLKVHTTLVGTSNDIQVEDDWYDTGDLIEMVGEAKFKIVGREGSLLNIGGYQVNPIYIENVINGIEYIKLCNVYSKSNSILGNILVCDVVLNSAYSKNIADIKSDIKEILNDYEVPTKINIVDEIKITENGKIERK
jgi:acyl-coenzyme A synthetase/AMP-(fatty) acid ligase